MSIKQEKGQFYSTNCDYILKGMAIPDNVKVIEPFTGTGEMVKWVTSVKSGVVEMYDIDSKFPGTLARDTLLDPPDYEGKWVVTNPPYRARNKSSDKSIFDTYGTNDLYKCFMYSILEAAGGVIIIPAGFFFSTRPIDVKCRGAFMKRFVVNRVNYFEERVFDDTPTTVVSISFSRGGGNLTSQEVPWVKFPCMSERTFHCCEADKWVVGGEIYNESRKGDIAFSRFVVGSELKTGQYQTFITLRALDSGTEGGRISLDYKDGYIYKGKNTSRTYATLVTTGWELTEDDQIELCKWFNEFIETKRSQYWSLFLPQYRESKEYARKRIPFRLVYDLLTVHLSKNGLFP